jgi:phosphoglycerate dehydrogenase-like enzyme
MPEVLVISRHAQRFAELIEARQLPGLEAHYCEQSEEALQHCDGAEILFGAPDCIAPVLAKCPRLRWVQSSWAGIKPLLECQRRDYRLTGVKDIFGPPMSEYVLAWLLGLERQLVQHATARHWDDTTKPGLAGKTIGIMGTGSIGSHVAGTCKAFGINTRGLNSDGRQQAGFDACFPLSRIAEFATNLDYLVALLPDTSATDNLLDAELLSHLKPGAIVINGGRANCIVEGDLVAALESGQLGHAVLDVMRQEPLPDEHPLWAVKNLHITSHTAAPTRVESIIEIFCDNYHRYIAGEELHYPIDFDRGY